MVDRNAIIAQFGGTSIGAIQTPVIRQFVDAPATPWIAGIGGFGQPSALISIISGAITMGAAIYGSTKKNGGQQRLSDTAVLGLLGHGTAALETGVLSGLFPVPVAVAATSGTMAGDFVPPQAQQMGGADMNMLQSMSAELQRLQTENMSLRNMQPQNMQTGTYPALIPQHTVTEKQLKFGFMEPTPQEYIAPGQPTQAARELGFMPGGRTRRPMAKVQAMRGKYGFLGE
jgi:hypothetical protein